MATSSFTPRQLREQLLGVGGEARNQRIDGDRVAFTKSKALVEELLEQLRNLYKKDSSPFDKSFLDDIRSVKICAGIITEEDLDKEAAERERQATMAAHEAFLRQCGLPYRGARLGLGRHRMTHCYNCKHNLDSVIDVECVICGWIVCCCGACGCGYPGLG